MVLKSSFTSLLFLNRMAPCVCAHVKNGEYIFSDDRIKYNFNINLEATIVKTTSNWIAHWYTVSEELVYMSISISEHLYSDYIEMLCVELRREMTIDEKIYMCLLKLSDRCAWSTRCSLCRMGQIYTRRPKKRMRSISIAKNTKRGVLWFCYRFVSAKQCAVHTYTPIHLHIKANNAKSVCIITWLVPGGTAIASITNYTLAGLIIIRITEQRQRQK